MTDSIFNSSNNTNNNAHATTGAYESLVGDGKKFADAEALAKSKVEADAFIESLKKDNAEIRQELSTRLSLEEFYNKTQQARNVNPPISSGNTNTVEQGVDNGKNAAPVQVSQEDVQKLVREALAREQTQATRNSNLSASREELKKVFGDDYGNHLAKRADDLGLDRTFVDEIASRSPKALLALIGEAPKTNDRYVAPPVAQRNTNQVAFTSNSPGVRNDAYWSEMKKSNLKEYMKPENQVQRHKDAQALGDKYFS